MRIQIAIAMLLLTALTGCFGPFTRFQSAEESERDKDLEVPLVGDMASSVPIGMEQISGVGLVTGLDGTGHSPQGPARILLEKQLLKQKIERVKDALDSPNNALVMVSALVPPGHRKGEPLDVEVTLPPNSRTTSLRGGYLHDCPLREYKARNNETVAGNILAHAQGSLLVGLGAPNSEIELRRGQAWEGGVFLGERPFYLRMKKGDKSYRVTQAVANRLNNLFREDPHKRQPLHDRLQSLDGVSEQLNQKFDPAAVNRGEVARAINAETLAISVPYAYRLNPERYVRIAQLVPLQETPEQRPKYRQRLLKMLLDPQETLKAAWRLEALGQDSIASLKKGLQSGDPLVRFAAAESLTYLGNVAGVEELARLAERHQPLRHWSLLALANLDESVSRAKLAELLDRPDPELRSGAFVAFRLLDRADPRSRDERLGAELLNEGYWLHQVAPQSTPLVYMSLSKRAEIVLFGRNVALTPPVKILAGPEFTITAERLDKRCTVSRIGAKGGVRHASSSLQVDDVLRTMAELGAQYPDVVEFLRKADERKCLNCPLRINNLPEPVPLETLAESGRDPQFLRD